MSGPSRAAPSAPADQRRRAVGVLLLGTLFWAAGGLIATGSPLGGPQLAFWRSLLGAALYQALLAVRGVRPTVEQIRRSALGGVGFGLSVVALFMAFKSTTLLTANVIGAVQPLLLVPVAVRSHGQHISHRALLAVVGAIVGTVICILGSTNSGRWSLHGDLLALLGVVTGCLYPIGTKAARATLSPLEFQAGALCVATVVTFPAALLFGGGWHWPSPGGFGWVLGLVAVGGTGHLLFSSAQRHLSVADTSTIALLEIVEVSLAAAVVFGQSIGVMQAVGMAAVIAAVGGFVRMTAVGQEIDPDGAASGVAVDR